MQVLSPSEIAKATKEDPFVLLRRVLVKVRASGILIGELDRLEIELFQLHSNTPNSILAHLHMGIDSKVRSLGCAIALSNGENQKALLVVSDTIMLLRALVEISDGGLSNIRVVTSLGQIGPYTIQQNDVYEQRLVPYYLAQYAYGFEAQVARDIASAKKADADEYLHKLYDDYRFNRFRLGTKPFHLFGTGLRRKVLQFQNGAWKVITSDYAMAVDIFVDSHERSRDFFALAGVTSCLEKCGLYALSSSVHNGSIVFKGWWTGIDRSAFDRFLLSLEILFEIIIKIISLGRVSLFELRQKQIEARTVELTNDEQYIAEMAVEELRRRKLENINSELDIELKRTELMERQLALAKTSAIELYRSGAPTDEMKLTIEGVEVPLKMNGTWDAEKFKIGLQHLQAAMQ